MNPAKATSLMFLLFATSIALATPTPQSSSQRIVVEGEITAINKLTESFELTSRRDRNSPVTIPTDGIRVGVRVGKGPSRDPSSSGETPGGVDPTFGGATTEGVGASDPRVRVVNFKTVVFISAKTVCRHREKLILCGELKIGDRIRVAGDERREVRGQGLFATEIIRSSP